MKKLTMIVLILAFSMTLVLPCPAQEDSAIAIIKAGLLGAGAGAIGGAASGAKGRDIWKGALAGAGTNIIGGALLDTITRSSTTTQTQRYYVQPQRAAYSQPVTYSQPSYTAHSTPGESFDDYFQRGYYLGYKEGYEQGFRDGMRQ